MPVTPKRMSAGHPQTMPLMVLLMFVIVVNISCSFPFPSSSKKTQFIRNYALVYFATIPHQRVKYKRNFIPFLFLSRFLSI